MRRILFSYHVVLSGSSGEWREDTWNRWMQLFGYIANSFLMMHGQCLPMSCSDQRWPFKELFVCRHSLKFLTKRWIKMPPWHIIKTFFMLRILAGCSVLLPYDGGIHSFSSNRMPATSLESRPSIGKAFIVFYDSILRYWFRIHDIEVVDLWY